MNYGGLFSSSQPNPGNQDNRSKPKPRSKPADASKNFGTSNVYAWIDLETTDLDHTKGHILEIALILTSANDLREIKRQHIIIHHGDEVFGDMSDSVAKPSTASPAVTRATCPSWTCARRPPFP